MAQGVNCASPDGGRNADRVDRLAKWQCGIYLWAVRLRDQDMQRIASAVLDRLEKGRLLHVTGKRADVEQRIVAALRKNMRTEEEIEAEAERFANAHSRELVGMDRHRVLQLVRDRIAKERGFTL